MIAFPFPQLPALTMKNIAENNLVRFINISKKKDGVFANFKVKGIRGGTSFSSSISVDLATLDLELAEDPIEKVIEDSAKVAVREFKKAELQFEGLQNV